MTDKTYAQFNSITITGRVSHAEVIQGQYGEFLAVTLLSELVNDGKAIAVQFNTTNGLLSLYKSGWLTNGRSVTVTGHLKSFAETYFNKETGKTSMLQRPRLTLDKAVVFDGGLGPAKKEDTVAVAPVDNAEVLMPAA
jgi:hypothetical protein